MQRITQQTTRVALACAAVYATTALHHVYGAWLYATPWRNHIAYQGFTWLIISLAILGAAIFWKSRVLKWIFVLFAGFFFVGAIGFYEGLYNHLLKNLLYFAGMDLSTLHWMYPPPKYELPNDLLFEVSGVLTLAICMWCLREMIRFLKRPSWTSVD